MAGNKKRLARKTTILRKQLTLASEITAATRKNPARTCNITSPVARKPVSSSDDSANTEATQGKVARKPGKRKAADIDDGSDDGNHQRNKCTKTKTPGKEKPKKDDSDVSSDGNDSYDDDDDVERTKVATIEATPTETPTNNKEWEHMIRKAVKQLWRTTKFTPTPKYMKDFADEIMDHLNVPELTYYEDMSKKEKDAVSEERDFFVEKYNKVWLRMLCDDRNYAQVSVRSVLLGLPLYVTNTYSFLM